MAAPSILPLKYLMTATKIDSAIRVAESMCLQCEHLSSLRLLMRDALPTRRLGFLVAETHDLGHALAGV